MGRGDSEVIKPSAKIRLRANNGVSSDEYTYKVESQNEPIQLPAKNEEFILNVAKLIYYPDIEDVSEDIVRKWKSKSDNKAHTKKERTSKKESKRSSEHFKHNNKNKNRLIYSMGSIFEKMDLKFD